MAVNLTRLSHPISNNQFHVLNTILARAFVMVSRQIRMLSSALF